MVHTVAGKAVLAALTFPMILEFLPILLPRHFCGLLNMVHGQRKTEENNGMDGEEVCFQDRVLTKLDEVLKNEPWKLGFSRVSNVKQGKKCGYYIRPSLEYSAVSVTFSLAFVGGNLVHLEMDGVLDSVLAKRCF